MKLSPRESRLPPRAVERLEGELGFELERPASAEHGDFATNAALQLAPERKRAPGEIAQELAEEATTHELVERAEVAGPGFVNLWLAPAWYLGALGEVLEAGEGYGGGFVDPVERVQVEMVSANPTGPITVASARNGAYGDSVARVFAHAGHTVEREYYYNDASGPRSRQYGAGRSRPRTATRARTSRSWPRSTATPFRRCFTRSSRRSSASESTSTRGGSRATSRSACPS